MRIKDDTKVPNRLARLNSIIANREWRNILLRTKFRERDFQNMQLLCKEQRWGSLRHLFLFPAYPHQFTGCTNHSSSTKDVQHSLMLYHKEMQYNHHFSC